MAQVGRPPKYNKGMAKKLLKYFSIEPYTYQTVTHFDKNTGKEWTTTEPIANDTPTFGGFCKRAGISRDTLYDWGEKHKEFSDALKRARDMIEEFLVVNGNKNLIAQPFAIFTAKNVLKWADKQDLDVKTNGKEIVSFNFMKPDGTPTDNPDNKTNA